MSEENKTSSSKNDQSVAKDSPPENDTQTSKPADPKVDNNEKMWQILRELQPQVPALIVVGIMGGLGACIARCWGITIGNGPAVEALEGASFVLSFFLGLVGAYAAVFLLARTDTSKLIHCGLIAVLSGMAGPYLVVRALGTVISDMDSNKISSTKIATYALAKWTETTSEQINKDFTGATDDNPKKAMGLA
jgi:hypothetical protein